MIHAMRRAPLAFLFALFLLAAPLAADDAPAPGKPFTQRIPGSDVTFNMMPIPAGKFLMGSPASEKGRKPDEGPQFTVEMDAFWMGACEVTQAEYKLFEDNYHRVANDGAPMIPEDKFADAVTYPTPIYELGVGATFDRMGRGGRFPAVTMSQYAARQYTKWLSKKTGRFYRLPTEAEWEYACRAGTTTAYNFGDDPAKLEQNGTYTDNAIPQGRADGAYRATGSQRKPNAWGLHDMHGNVAEWCIDAYAADWYQRFAGKTVNWHDAINWPTSRYPRVIRGGGWDSEAEECRSASRRGSDEKLNMDDLNIPQSAHWDCSAFWLGFRIVSPLKEPPEAEKRKFWDADDQETIKTLKRDREIREIPTRGK
jgi:formylglycine-generating enzyme required for sulfatase activity